MHRNTVAALVLAGVGLCGCTRGATDSEGRGGQHGRYTGVGLYGPSKQWTKLIANQQTTDPHAAQPIDDQVIIVVQDSVTGEVRACGDLTGYCIGMNPWKAALTSAQIAPIKLTEHQKPDEPAVADVFPTKRDKSDKLGSASEAR